MRALQAAVRVQRRHGSAAVVSRQDGADTV